MNRSQIAIEVFDKNADIYREKFMNVDSYADALNLFCDTLNNEQAGILDVACGPGNITGYLLQQHPGYQILGTDLSQKMLALAQAHNPSARFQLLDAKAITSLQQQFDGIVCGFCFPYLSKEEVMQFIADCATCLPANGALYISTMEDDHANSGLERNSAGDEVYVYYYQSEFLVDALEQNSFTVIETFRQDYIYNNKTINDLILVARKS
ncbi:MAG: class I SAM-dependent methyltransferase [Sphingobacteriales bacterium]|nr:MAG: class I SAM-dependent methyltransferase [Sphingobacteriales bacterium]